MISYYILGVKRNLGKIILTFSKEKRLGGLTTPWLVIRGRADVHGWHTVTRTCWDWVSIASSRPWLLRGALYGLKRWDTRTCLVFFLTKYYFKSGSVVSLTNIPGRIRTHNLQIRSLLHYPIMLQEQKKQPRTTVFHLSGSTESAPILPLTWVWLLSTADGIWTHTGRILSPLSLPIGLRRQKVTVAGFEPAFLKTI